MSVINCFSVCFGDDTAVAAEPIIPSQFHMADMLEPLFTDQAKVVLTEDWSFHRGLFTEKYEGKGPRKKIYWS